MILRQRKSAFQIAIAAAFSVLILAGEANAQCRGGASPQSGGRPPMPPTGGQQYPMAPQYALQQQYAQMVALQQMQMLQQQQLQMQAQQQLIQQQAALQKQRQQQKQKPFYFQLVSNK